MTATLDLVAVVSSDLSICTNSCATKFFRLCFFCSCSFLSAPTVRCCQRLVSLVCVCFINFPGSVLIPLPTTSTFRTVCQIHCYDEPLPFLLKSPSYFRSDIFLVWYWPISRSFVAAKLLLVCQSVFSEVTNPVTAVVRAQLQYRYVSVRFSWRLGNCFPSRPLSELSRISASLHRYFHELRTDCACNRRTGHIMDLGFHHSVTHCQF